MKRLRRSVALPLIADYLVQRFLQQERRPTALNIFHGNLSIEICSREGEAPAELVFLGEAPAAFFGQRHNVHKQKAYAPLLVNGSWRPMKRLRRSVALPSIADYLVQRFLEQERRPTALNIFHGDLSIEIWSREGEAPAELFLGYLTTSTSKKPKPRCL
jgi:homospermidine synthase